MKTFIPFIVLLMLSITSSAQAKPNVLFLSAILNLELRQQHFSLFLFPSSFSVEEISRKQ
jgi:hypothetical protein